MNTKPLADIWSITQSVAIDTHQGENIQTRFFFLNFTVPYIPFVLKASFLCSPLIYFRKCLLLIISLQMLLILLNFHSIAAIAQRYWIGVYDTCVTISLIHFIVTCVDHFSKRTRYCSHLYCVRTYFCKYTGVTS